MNKFYAFLTLYLLTYSSIVAAQLDEKIDISAPHDKFWNAFETDCIGRNIYYDLFWLDYGFNLSLNSFAVGMHPDSNNGPSFIARLDSGLSHQFLGTVKNNNPTVFLAWSLPGATCMVKTDFNECPAAKSSLDKLKNTKLSLSENSGNEYGSKFMHYTEFNLQFMDGASHLNEWQITSGKSEIEKVISSIAQDTYECSKGAVNKLFKRLKIDEKDDQFISHSKRFNLDKE